MVVLDEGRYARILDSYYVSNPTYYYPRAYALSDISSQAQSNKFVQQAENALKPLCATISPIICPFSILFYLAGGALLVYGGMKGFKKDYLLWGGLIVGGTFLATHACCQFKTLAVVPPAPETQKVQTKPATKPATKPTTKPGTTKPSAKPAAEPKATDPFTNFLNQAGKFLGDALKTGSENLKSNVRGFGGEEVGPLL